MKDGPLIKHAMRRAIQDRRVLVYSTEEGVSHVIEPHAYGITYEDDEVLIGWRCEAKVNGPIAQGGWELVRLRRNARRTRFRANIRSTTARL